MTIEQEKTEAGIKISLNGRLDTESAPKLEKELDGVEKETDVEMDFLELKYITSAGLRVLLKEHKKRKEAGRKLEICHVNPQVLEVFEITGFLEYLNIRREEV